MKEPKDSQAFPNVLQYGGQQVYQTKSLFWNVCNDGFLEVLDAMIQLMTVHQMIERIDLYMFSLQGILSGDYSYANMMMEKANAKLLQTTLFDRLRSDCCYLQAADDLKCNILKLYLHPYHVAQTELVLGLDRIAKTHTDYKHNAMPMLALTLPDIGLLSCFAPLVQSFLF
jgi:hypothetical protein